MFKSLKKLFKKTGDQDKPSEQDILNEQISKSVNDFKNRPIYKVLTEEIIDKTPDDELLQVIFDNICEKLQEGQDTEYQTLLTISKSQQAIYAIWWLEAEVNNGGFNQYYANSSVEYAIMTPEALMLIEANKFSDLVSKSNFIYQSENEKITHHQDGTVEGFSKSYNDNPLNHFDDEFFELYKTEKLNKLQIEFIRKNKFDFIDK